MIDNMVEINTVFVNCLIDQLSLTYDRNVRLFFFSFPSSLIINSP